MAKGVGIWKRRHSPQQALAILNRKYRFSKNNMLSMEMLKIYVPGIQVVSNVEAIKRSSK